jgi:hypothetical protein
MRQKQPLSGPPEADILQIREWKAASDFIEGARGLQAADFLGLAGLDPAAILAILVVHARPLGLPIDKAA